MSQTTQQSSDDGLSDEEVAQYFELAHIDSEDDLNAFLQHFDITSREELEDYIQHYGVLGMKWGVRRSDEELRKENPDKYRRRYDRVKKKAGRKTFEEMSGGEKTMSVLFRGLAVQKIMDHNTSKARTRLRGMPSKPPAGNKRGTFFGPDKWSSKSDLQKANTIMWKGAAWAWYENRTSNNVS